jgi:DNA-binding MarR family transcriptional regulator
MEVERLIDMKAVDKKKAGTDMSRDEAVYSLWLLSVQIHQLFGQAIDAVCASVGISRPQFAMLYVLKYSVKPVRIVDLASYLHQNPNSASMMVDRMVKQGLVMRAKTKSDRRAVVVKLTRHGNHVATQAIPTSWQMIKTLATAFSDSEISQLPVMLEKFKQQLCDGLKKIGEETQAEGFFKELDTHRPVKRFTINDSP